MDLKRVQDLVDRPFLGHVEFDEVEEGRSVHGSVCFAGVVKDPATGHVQRGDEGGGAFALVVVSYGSGPPQVIGSDGWAGSSARLWLSMSKQKTAAHTGGLRNSPTTSTTSIRTHGHKNVERVGLSQLEVVDSLRIPNCSARGRSKAWSRHRAAHRLLLHAPSGPPYRPETATGRPNLNDPAHSSHAPGVIQAPKTYT